MKDLTPQVAAELVSACRENSAGISEALQSGFGMAATVEVDEAAAFTELPPAELDGPGLVVAMQFGDVAAAAIFSQTSGLVPDWARSPDAAGTERLSTLAQQLATLVAPEGLVASKTASGWVDGPVDVLTAGQLSPDACAVAVRLKSEQQTGQFVVVWPCADEGALFERLAGDAAASAPSKKRRRPVSWSALPPYAKHLLKIEVPVTVNLVAKKLSVEEVIELGPGAMISFDKSCDGPLELAVGDCAIAAGTVVKVGEFFGLEISEMILPEEHFIPVKPIPAGRA